jgi:hypothetical protein
LSLNQKTVLDSFLNICLDNYYVKLIKKILIMTTKIVCESQTLKRKCPHCKKDIRAIKFPHLNNINAYLTEDAKVPSNIRFLGCLECNTIFFEVL